MTADRWEAFTPAERATLCLGVTRVLMDSVLADDREELSPGRLAEIVEVCVRLIEEINVSVGNEPMDHRLLERVLELLRSKEGG